MISLTTLRLCKSAGRFAYSDHLSLTNVTGLKKQATLPLSNSCRKLAKLLPFHLYIIMHYQVALFKSQ